MAKENKISGFSLKDHLFNKSKIQFLASQFQAADASFDATGFVGGSMKGLRKLELKQRIVHIANVLESFLSSEYSVAAKQITKALPPPLDPRKTDDDFGDFIFAPLGEFVVRNGMAKKHVRLSLSTLKQLTQRFSMEDAIRYFINNHTDQTMAELEKWASNRNYHVRRLVSEGTRAMLPWSKRLSIETTAPLPFLDALHTDPTRYVTRSVANHLNDIAKSHPKEVLAYLKNWKNKGEQDPTELQWMSKHALRTLIKQGDPQALRFLGFRPSPKLKVTDFKLKSKKLKPGQAIEFSFTATAKRDEALMVDYIIDFVKANGTLSPKVHKLKQISLHNGESITLSKRHVLRAAATTYTLYPGIHHVTLQINGNRFGTQSFELV